MARPRRPGMSSGGGVLRLVERTGVRKGMAGSKSWFYVGTGLWTLRTIRRLAERKEVIVLSEPLAPGQRITIANGVATFDDDPTATVEPKGRRARKRARKAARRDARART